MRNYDFIAPFYDLLSSLIFGKKLRKASISNIDDLLNSGRLLMIGGGTGDILTELEKRNFKGDITYVDSSPSMIRIAKKKLISFKVEFVCCPIQDFVGEKYDSFHIAFFLDQFSEIEMKDLLVHIRTCLSSSAQGTITDFIQAPGNIYSILLWTMYRFFNLFAGVKARSLADWQMALKDTGFICIKQQSHFKGRIVSGQYKV